MGNLNYVFHICLSFILLVHGKILHEERQHQQKLASFVHEKSALITNSISLDQYQHQSSHYPNSTASPSEEQNLRQYLTKLKPKLLQYCQSRAHAIWNLQLHPLDKEVQEKNVQAQVAYDDFLQIVKSELSKFPNSASLNDPILKSNVEKLIEDSTPILTGETRNKKFVELLQTIELKKALKSKALFESNNNEDQPVFHSGISPKAYFNRLYKKSKSDWKKYYNNLGKQFKASLPEFMSYSKEYLKNWFITVDQGTKVPLYDEFQKELHAVQELWDSELSPLFQQLHAYVRGTLKLLYSRQLTKGDQLIPINMIGVLDSWLDVYVDTIPFENAPARDDITEALIVRLNISTIDIYREVEEFFLSIDLPPMQTKFWTDSIFGKPESLGAPAPATGTENLQKHGAARIDEDGEGDDLAVSGPVCDNILQSFCYQNETRLIECDGVNFFTLLKAYPSLGNAKLYMLANNMEFLPVPELDEVVIEALNMVWNLFGSTPERFRRMYLLEPTKYRLTSSQTAADEIRKVRKRLGEVSLNFQHLQALYVFPELANIISTQNWFWSVYNNTNESDISVMNCEFWKLRAQFEGVAPPVRRNRSNFDAFGLMNTSTYKMVQKFIGYVMAFQIHKELCITAGEYEVTRTEKAEPEPTTTTLRYSQFLRKKTGSSSQRSRRRAIRWSRKLLHNCDITDSKAVGKKLRALGASGSLSDWRKTLEFLTGSAKLSTGAMMEYFKPYFKWVGDTNRKSRYTVGWKSPKGSKSKAKGKGSQDQVQPGIC